MRKLMLIAAVVLGSATFAASPAQSQVYVDTRANARLYVRYDDDWRWRDGRRWDRRWDRDDRRRWQRRHWRRHARRGWGPPPCRRMWWDGWGWRCVR
jgi:hypothetical protein